MKKILIIAFGLLAMCSFTAFAAQKTIVVLPERVSAAEADTIKKNLRGVLLKMEAGDSLQVYGGNDVISIGKTKLPDNEDILKVKMKFFNKTIMPKISDWLDSNQSQSPDVNRIFLPKVMRKVSLADNNGANLVIFALPLIPDGAGEGYLPFELGYPSDSHVLATTLDSAFGTKDWGGTKNMNFKVSFIYPKNGVAWVRDVHEQKVSRFIALYLQALGSRSCFFTSDMSVLNSSCSVAEPTIEADAAKKKLQFIILQSATTSIDWIFQNKIEILPPAERVGQLEIAIKWPQQIDLDIYADYEGHEISYKTPAPSGGAGILVKDITTSPTLTNGYETIVFNKPIDITKLKIAVNYYGGSGSGDFTLRAKFNQKIYSFTGKLAANAGNHGAGERVQPFWQIIDARKLFKLN